LTAGDSAAFTVVAGTATQLVFTTQPSSPATGGSAFSPNQPVVSVEDANNNVATDTRPITLAITSGTGTAGAVLGCNNNTVSAVAGIATFAGCDIDKIGSGYTLTAT